MTPTNTTISNIEQLLERYVQEEKYGVALELAKALGNDNLAEVLAALIIDRSEPNPIALTADQKIEPTVKTYLPQLEKGKEYIPSDYLDGAENARRAKDYHHVSILYEKGHNIFSAASAAEKAGETERAAELYFKCASVNRNGKWQHVKDAYHKAVILYGQLGDTIHAQEAAQKTKACTHIISLESLFEKGLPHGEDALHAYSAIERLVELSERDMLFIFVKELYNSRNYECVEFCLAKLMWDGHRDVHNALAAVIRRDKKRLTQERKEYAQWLYPLNSDGSTKDL